MRKILTLVLLLTASCRLSLAQVDSAALARMDAMLRDYVAALEPESPAVKSSECDFLIETCADSILRQRVASSLYTHYHDSRLMGDEAVAIGIYDRWFATGRVTMADPMAQMDAAVFAQFNRNSLVGMPAPVLEITDTLSAPLVVGGPGERQRVLYFYDTSCPKCKLESIVLRSYLDMCDADLDLYAICTGTDYDAWMDYIHERFTFTSERLRVFHGWDPEGESDMQMQYGLLQTPKMFFLSEDGTILGRRLTVEALQQLVAIGQMERELHDRNAVGGTLPQMVLPGRLVTARGSRERQMDISRLKGRPAYLVLHAEGCSNCQKELEAMNQGFRKGMKVFIVNVDRYMADDMEKARELFDAFDLTELPHIISVDRKGIITDRYISFQ